MNRVLRLLGLCMLTASLALSVSACGKKKEILRPEGSTYPKQYPRE